MRCHRPLIAPWHLSALALLILLASCQGTQFGTAVEQAVAPAPPPAPERTPDSDNLDADNPDASNSEVDNPDADNPSPENTDAENGDRPGLDLDDLDDTSQLDSNQIDATAEPDGSDSDSRPDPADSDRTDLDESAEDDSRDSSASDTSAQAPSSRFTDLDDSSQSTEAIAALDDLGVFDDIETDEFQPNRSVRRQEFARWVTLAHNAAYARDPNRQLALAEDGDTPLFLDVPEDRPTFPHIQALANADIVEMRADREFEPDNLLSRADLLAIKVALDLGPNNLSGSLEDVERDWGFEDSADIRAGDIPAIATDFTLGQASNILRTFGLADNLEPQAPVTRSEVALAISSFGLGEEQRSVLPEDSSATESSDRPSTEPEDGPDRPDEAPPQSTKNPQPNDSPNQVDPSNTEPGGREQPDPIEQPEPEADTNSGESSAENAPSEGAQDGGGRFLDL